MTANELGYPAHTTMPDSIIEAVGKVAGALSAVTSRPPEDFLPPLLGAVTVLWGEARRQEVLNVHRPLTTESLEALQRATGEDGNKHVDSTQDR